jgi:acyl carrier protein
VASVRRWQQRFGTRIRLLNLYGSTEATMVQFFHVVQDRDLDAGVIPIGRPMEGDRARLLDGHDRPCSPGNVGELCIESPSLSLGYHRDAEATRASFRTPAGHGVPDRYRTGDLAMELPDGTYRLLGRKDDQVKVRGVRVEPREVEAALVEHPQIAECAVTGQSEGDRGASLAAYVVCTSPDRPSVTDLRLHLSQRLPQEMMPAQVVFLDRLPRGPNGKVDRAALPLPGTVPSPEGRVAPPRTRIEQALVHIWSDVLGLPSVGIHDHFADRGGHSLMAMQIVTRIREALGVDLPVRAILEQSTIAQLAAEIAGRRVPTLPDGGAGPAEREARSP